MRNTAKVLLIILAAIAWQQVVADTENFDDLPAGDWLNDSGSLLAMPPFWSVDTGTGSFGHPDYPGFIRVLDDGAPFGNGNHWLEVRLIANGTTVNKAAIGCQVKIAVPELGTLVRQVCGGRGNYTHQDDQKLHFGLGAHAGPVTLQVHWLDGSVQHVTTATDRIVTVRQDGDVR